MSLRGAKRRGNLITYTISPFGRNDSEFMKRPSMKRKMNLSTTCKPMMVVNIGGLTLKNPVMTASGTFGYGEEYAPYLDIDRLGAVIVKGISLEPRAGNPPPRIMETPCGMLNAIGLENPGVNIFINEKLPFLRKLKAAVIVNVYGETIDEFKKVAEILSSTAGVHGLDPHGFHQRGCTGRLRAA